MASGFEGLTILWFMVAFRWCCGIGIGGVPCFCEVVLDLLWVGSVVGFSGFLALWFDLMPVLVCSCGGLFCGIVLGWIHCA